MSDKTVRSLTIEPGTDEFEIWTTEALPLLQDLPENVLRICAYGFTEMLNNVIEHSDSKSAALSLENSPDKVLLSIFDSGLGIFRKIQLAAELANEHDAFLELAKGRFTTDPDRHTGEGIFFTARMFDRFVILSGSMYVSFSAEGRDWVLESPHRVESPTQGTLVEMEINPQSVRTTREVLSRCRLKKLVAPLPMGSASRSASYDARTATISRSLDT